MATPSVSTASIIDPNIIIDTCLVMYDVLGEKWQTTAGKVAEAVADLMLTNDKSSLIFTNIVISRSIVQCKSAEETKVELPIKLSIPIEQKVRLIAFTGEVMVDKFLQIVKFPEKISEEHWLAHMHKFVTTK